MPDTLVHGNYAFTIKELDGAEELKIHAITMPSGSIEIGVVKHFGEKNGTPVPLSGGGHQTTWAPIEITRYKDDEHGLLRLVQGRFRRRARSRAIRRRARSSCATRARRRCSRGS